MNIEKLFLEKYGLRYNGYYYKARQMSRDIQKEIVDGFHTCLPRENRIIKEKMHILFEESQASFSIVDLDKFSGFGNKIEVKDLEILELVSLVSFKWEPQFPGEKSRYKLSFGYSLETKLRNEKQLYESLAKRISPEYHMKNLFEKESDKEYARIIKDYLEEKIIGILKAVDSVDEFQREIFKSLKSGYD